MTRAEMIDLILTIAKESKPEDLEYIHFLYDVDVTHPQDYGNDQLAEVINAWSDFDKGFGE